VETVDDVLAHYGVLGMKWGQHLKSHGVKATVKKAATEGKAHVKKDLKERTSTETTVRAKKGQHVQVVGGVGRSAHDDAIQARVAEQVAKRNTLDALSNKELQSLVTRMNLEAQYRQYAVKETRMTAGEKFAQKFLADNTDKAVALLGPGAAVGKQVVDAAVKSTTANKALTGGIVDKKKDK
jgi:hypothetical protein